MSRTLSATEIDHQLFATLLALGDYLRDVVVVGGWVPHLYRGIWPTLSPVEPRRTFDLDAAVPRRLPVRHRPRLDVLLAEEGYSLLLRGHSELPTQIFQSPPYTDLLPIEFLAPLTGARDETTVVVQRGVTAQALRYLNILLENTFEVRVSTEARAGARDELSVRIPIPGAYVYHRGLISQSGGRRRRGKDLYYIFETWESLPNQRHQMVAQIAQMRDRYARAWYGTFRSNLERLFASSAAEGVLLVFQEYIAKEPAEIAHERIYQAFRGLLRSAPDR
jgi:hypothetical protein